MPLPNRMTDLEDDPTHFTDLSSHSNGATCPFCGSDVASHAENDLEPEHDHVVLSEHEICRRLYTCPRAGRDFYAYLYLENPRTFAVAPLLEGGMEKVDDSEMLQLGKKKFNGLKPKWRFKTKLATKEDLTEAFAKNLVVGLEIELDFRSDSNSVSESTLARVFGVSPSDYHHPAPCPSCGAGGCWQHQPDNFIRAIERDSSINGWEFIVYGGPVSSEHFARKLPLGKMAEYFKPTYRDSIHTHALLLHSIPKIPSVIGKNMWQLFRYYYPAWVYLFGNNKRDTGFLREQPSDRDYVPFKFFNKSPFTARWAVDVRNADHLHGGAGLFMRGVPVERPEMDSFDAEIRTSDSSLDLEQIIALRSGTRALILRAVQLSNFGLISVETDEKMWENVKAVITKLNARSGITDSDEGFMRDHAIAFVRELSPFLSDFERTCFKHLIENPVRNRSESQQVKVIIPELSETAKSLRKLIALAEVTADSRDDWIAKVAIMMDTDKDAITIGLREIKAFYDSTLKTMVANE